MNQQEIFVKMVLDAWHNKVNQFDNLLSELTDEQLEKEVSPGRNRGLYIAGHLTTMVLFMIPQLGFGESPTPTFADFFVKNPDRTFGDMPGPAPIRAAWKKGSAELEQHISNSAVADWFLRHSSVTEEAFAKEPHRNKLNLLLSRACHFDYHLGQMVLLKSRP